MLAGHARQTRESLHALMSRVWLIFLNLPCRPRPDGTAVAVLLQVSRLFRLCGALLRVSLLCRSSSAFFAASRFRRARMRSRAAAASPMASTSLAPIGARLAFTCMMEASILLLSFACAERPAVSVQRSGHMHPGAMSPRTLPGLFRLLREGQHRLSRQDSGVPQESSELGGNAGSNPQPIAWRPAW